MRLIPLHVDGVEIAVNADLITAIYPLPNPGTSRHGPSGFGDQKVGRKTEIRFATDEINWLHVDEPYALVVGVAGETKRS